MKSQAAPELRDNPPLQPDESKAALSKIEDMLDDAMAYLQDFNFKEALPLFREIKKFSTNPIAVIAYFWLQEIYTHGYDGIAKDAHRAK